MILILVFCVIFVSLVSCNPAPAPTENYKDQYCTDPRTMRKHAAYTEWADAYSCSRHRCQPGGRNLAIYTVGCKRVEAPESAIECEEVVEDTNMQFPYCCTRLRCLVVVRGEVWTRVLGQPWETLPAAPWSHMYKMKKPPPGDSTFLPKGPEQGPIYELTEPENDTRDKVLRAGTTENPECNDVVPRASMPGPDIVWSTITPQVTCRVSSIHFIEIPCVSDSGTGVKCMEKTSHVTCGLNVDHPKYGRNNKRKKSPLPAIPYFEEEKERDVEVQEIEDLTASSDKPLEQTSDEKMFINTIVGQKSSFKPKQNVRHQSWTEMPPSQWDSESEDNTRVREEPMYNNQADFPEERSEKKEEKPSNLQALVDAIGTRMRDIENVVQRMSEKVQQTKPEDELSTEKRQDLQKKQHSKEHNKMKKKDPDGENYNRFSGRGHGSKYLRTSEFSTEPPIFLEDSHLNGYYSDASNSLVRRVNGPKEPAQTYMAPVETRRKPSDASSDDAEKKRKKHHKRKNRKHNHKKHHAKDEKKKRFNKLASTEAEKNTVSLEDSSIISKK